MRIDARKTRAEMAKRGMRRKDIVAAGITLGSVNNGLNENRISQSMAERIAKAIGCRLDEIIKTE